MPRWFRRQAIPRIRSGEVQIGLAKAASIDQLKSDMLAGRFNYRIPEARISGWLDEQGTFYLCEGHHRVNAALEIYWETGDRVYLDRLIEHGRWTPARPPMNRRLPTRRLFSRFLSVLELWIR